MIQLGNEKSKNCIRVSGITKLPFPLFPISKCTASDCMVACIASCAAAQSLFFQNAELVYA